MPREARADRPRAGRGSEGGNKSRIARSRLERSIARAIVHPAPAMAVATAISATIAIGYCGIRGGTTGGAATGWARPVMVIRDRPHRDRIARPAARTSEPRWRAQSARNRSRPDRTTPSGSDNVIFASYSAKPSAGPGTAAARFL
jgi:hypothetical protein